jgi:hypothetical protein
MNWILVIFLAGSNVAVSDVKNITMTEPQCKTVVREMSTSPELAVAICVGPNGELFSFEDAKPS